MINKCEVFKQQGRCKNRQRRKRILHAMINLLNWLSKHLHSMKNQIEALCKVTATNAKTINLSSEPHSLLLFFLVLNGRVLSFST